jgi:hypothetical protein
MHDKDAREPTWAPEASPGFWINRVSRALLRRGDASLRPLGFAMSYLPVLRAVASAGRPLSQTALARAVGVERGGVVGCPVSSERWLFLSREPPEDRVSIAAEHLSPAWEAMVVDEAKNWYVVFFIADRAVASSLGDALVTGGDIDAILDRGPGIVGVDSGPWR